MAFYGNCIFTSRLCLKKLAVNDLELLAEWSRMPEANSPYLSSENLDIEQLTHQLNSGALWNDKEKRFMVWLKKGIPIGSIRYWTVSAQFNTVVISVKIARESDRNKGYGTESQKFLIKHLMENENIQQVQMYTDINNIPQQRCLVKLGFKMQEAVQYQDHDIMRNGLLFTLSEQNFVCHPIYRYHNE